MAIFRIKLSASFFYGLGFWAGIHMLIQDWMGLEGYIEYLREAWINLPWWVGASAAAMCVVFEFLRNGEMEYNLHCMYMDMKQMHMKLVQSEKEKNESRA